MASIPAIRFKTVKLCLLPLTSADVPESAWPFMMSLYCHRLQSSREVEIFRGTVLHSCLRLQGKGTGQPGSPQLPARVVMLRPPAERWRVFTETPLELTGVDNERLEAPGQAPTNPRKEIAFEVFLPAALDLGLAFKPRSQAKSLGFLKTRP